MISIAFFNNESGVGKTSLVYHLACMYGELGCRVLAADLDPQANLSIMALDASRLEDLWPDDEHPETIYGAVQPLFGGTGDIRDAHIEALTERVALLVGDLALARLEDDLSTEWPRCLEGRERAFRVTSTFWRLIERAAQDHAERLGRPTKAYERWHARIPWVYRESVLGDRGAPRVDSTPPVGDQIARIKHYRSLMPLAMDARKPMFLLKPADGAIGAHQTNVQQCYVDFRTLAEEVARRTRLGWSGHP